MIGGQRQGCRRSEHASRPEGCFCQATSVRGATGLASNLDEAHGGVPGNPGVVGAGCGGGGEDETCQILRNDGAVPPRR